MAKIQIVPVIDIKDGKAVEAKEGKRDQYQELKSNICNSSNPLDVARAYERLGFMEVYIADLDGILNSKPKYPFSSLNRLVSAIPMLKGMFWLMLS